MLLEPIRLMAAFGLYVNVILGVFNLIPIPPLDGGMVMTGLLPPKQAEVLAKIEPFGFILLIFVIFFTDVWRLFLAPFVFSIVGVLAGPQVVVVDKVMRFLLGH